MPSTYTHYAFALEVRKRLKPTLKRIVSHYEDEYLAGAQGPDFLLFYFPPIPNPISRQGIKIHQKPAIDFFEPARNLVTRQGIDSPCGAYVSGCLCHFMLDSGCHKTVEDWAKHTEFSHLSIESELDRFMLLRDGENPATFRLGNLIPVTESCIRVMAPFYPDVRPDNIRLCLETMKVSRNFFTAEHPGKRFLLTAGFKSIGMYHRFGGILLPDREHPECSPAVHDLYQRYCDEIGNTARLIADYFTACTGNGSLPRRFERNYE